MLFQKKYHLSCLSFTTNVIFVFIDRFCDEIVFIIFNVFNLFIILQKDQGSSELC